MQTLLDNPRFQFPKQPRTWTMLGRALTSGPFLLFIKSMLQNRFWRRAIRTFAIFLLMVLLASRVFAADTQMDGFGTREQAAEATLAWGAKSVSESERLGFGFGSDVDLQRLRLASPFEEFTIFSPQIEESKTGKELIQRRYTASTWIFPVLFDGKPVAVLRVRQTEGTSMWEITSFGRDLPADVLVALSEKRNCSPMIITWAETGKIFFSCSYATLTPLPSTAAELPAGAGTLSDTTLSKLKRLLRNK